MTPPPPAEVSAMTRDGGDGTPGRDRGAIPIESLLESYRFDDEMARLLTAFQYHRDGIQLSSDKSRKLPADAYEATTPGLEAVFDPTASLVFVVHDDRGHRMTNPVETDIVTTIADAMAEPPDRPSKSNQTDEASADGAVGEGPSATTSTTDDGAPNSGDGATDRTLSEGVVTPHNAQRGTLSTALPDHASNRESEYPRTVWGPIGSRSTAVEEYTRRSRGLLKAHRQQEH
jgi:hypothetical protein